MDGVTEELEKERKKGAALAARAVAAEQEVEAVSTMLENERRRGERRAKDDEQRFDEVSSLFAREKKRAAEKAKADKEENDLLSSQLERERARGQAREAQIMALERDNAQLKEEMAAEKDLLSSELERERARGKARDAQMMALERDNALLKDEVAEKDRKLAEKQEKSDRVINENEDLRRKLEEMNAKESAQSGAKQPKEEPADNQSAQIPSFTGQFDEPKMDPDDDSRHPSDVVQMPPDVQGDSMDFKEDDMSVGDVMQPAEFMDDLLDLNNETAEQRDLSNADQNLFNDLSNMEDADGTTQSEMGNDLFEEEGEKEEPADQNTKDSSDEKRRSSRSAVIRQKYAESSDDSDREEGTQEKKSRSEPQKCGGKKRKSSNRGVSQSESSVKKPRVSKMNGTDIECIECEYRTRSVGSWLKHLRLKHSTTPIMAGLALLCECGHECASIHHSLECDIANFTVIRKGDGPIRRLDDEKTTPQCILCEMYPKTAYGYASHINDHHKTTLKANGLYLNCACGDKVTSSKYNKKHNEKCDGRQFSLHRLDED